MACVCLLWMSSTALNPLSRLFPAEGGLRSVRDSDWPRHHRQTSASSYPSHDLQKMITTSSHNSVFQNTSCNFYLFSLNFYFFFLRILCYILHFKFFLALIYVYILPFLFYFVFSYILQFLFFSVHNAIFILFIFWVYISQYVFNFPLRIMSLQLAIFILFYTLFWVTS